MPHKFFLYIFVFLFGFQGIAQKSEYYFPDVLPTELRLTGWTLKEGLPSQGLRGIFQSSDGYIWLASYEGLIRFDGFEFKLYSSKTDSVFKNNICEKIVESKNGVLWVSTRGGLLYYKEKKFHRYIFPDSLGNISRVIFIDSKNRLWLNSETKGLFYIKDNKLYLFDNKKLSEKGIWSITEDECGNVYFGSKNHFIIKFNGKTFEKYVKPTQVNSAFYISLHFYNGKLYWIDDLNLLYYYDGKSVHRDKVFTGQIYSATVDKNGDRWVTTPKGIYRQKKNKEKRSLIFYTPDYAVDQTLIDREGNLWMVIYRKGLKKLSVGKFEIINESFGLNGKICNTVCEIDENVVLAGYENGNIDKIKNGKISIFLSADKIRNGRIRYIMKDSKENLWISTYKGLLKLSATGKYKWFDVSNGMPTNSVRMTFEDSKHNIWAANKTKGIVKINKDGAVKLFPEFETLETSQLLSIRENNEGELLIATTGNGLYILKNGKLVKPSNLEAAEIVSVFDTYCDSDGTNWIVTNGNGIYRYKNEHFFAFNYQNGLANDSPFSLIEDDSGYFWIPYNSGLMKVSKKQLNDFADGRIDKYQCKVYDDTEGAEPLMFTPAAKSIKTSDGKIWLPLLNGIAIVDPANIHKNYIAPLVHIEKFIVDNVCLDNSQNIVVDAGKQHFSFKFTAICLQNPKKIKFKYKLEGFDNNWVEVGSDIRNVAYTNLHYGTYTFKVKACNDDGVWNNKAAEIKFEIKPFIYEIIWFKIAVVLLFVFIVFLVYKYRVIKIKKNEEKLKRVVKERTEMITAQKREIEMQNEKILNINNVLFEQKEQLEKHKHHLEELVEERTAELEEAKRKAEESDRLKSAFLDNISHEIRTPLNGILGFAQILKLQDLKGKNREKYFDIIIESANQLLKIVDEIMYISKIQAGIEKKKESKVDINKIINDLYEFYKLIAESKKLKIRKIDKDCALTVKTDEEKLNQILSVLINNAIKFTNTGFIEFGCCKKGNFVEFFVKDTGIGIPKENNQKIFISFAQAIDTTNREHGGLGLGLAISKAYVELLGGKIWFESEQGKGTTFYFTIPALD